MAKIAYFDCFSGAAGDMIVAAALDAGADEKYLRAELARLLLEEIQPEISKVTKNGIAATRFSPICRNKNHAHDHKHEHGHEHSRHRNLSTIIETINNARLSEKVQRQAIAIFQRLARAEAKVHGISEEEVHFHEVGAADAIADIVGSCLALESLGVEKIYCSRLTVGSGTVKCEHGVLPVPAPATVELIKGIELLGSNITGELLTPTGAAILTTLAQGFSTMPSMKIDQIGYGAGSRDIHEQPNVLRLIVGRLTDNDSDKSYDQVCVLDANIDDATAELTAYVAEKLLANGALDVICRPVTMKKGRCGTEISVICHSEQINQMEHILFSESTTLGIRRCMCQRSILPREIKTVATPFGPIRIKVGFLDGKAVTRSVEFSDCQQAAQKHNVTVKQVIAAAMAMNNQN
jgi:uncharacterized protein (TIGR00299 family) protein